MHPRDLTSPRHRRSRHRRRAALLAVVGTVVLGGAAAAVVGLQADQATPGTVGQRASSVSVEAVAPSRGRSAVPTDGPGGLPARGPVVRAAAVLRDWDEQRAQAWAAGDARRLRRLYVDGAGATDVRLLRRYAERGYRVEGLTTQLLAVDVLERAPDRWRLRVTDRVARGFAVGDGERLRLPRDRADTRLVVLTRGADGTWRVAEVRPVRR